MIKAPKVVRVVRVIRVSRLGKLTECLGHSPPVVTTIDRPRCLPIVFSTDDVCSANSRVGTHTTARGRHTLGGEVMTSRGGITSRVRKGKTASGRVGHVCVTDAVRISCESEVGFNDPSKGQGSKSNIYIKYSASLPYRSCH